MNILLEKHDLILMLEALDAYQLDIDHGTENGYEYSWTYEDVENLKNTINKYLED